MLQSGAPGIDADDPAVIAILEGSPPLAVDTVRAEPKQPAGAVSAPGEGEAPPEAGAAPEAPEGYEGAEEHPVVKGARKAPDGKFYVPHPQKPGRYMEVVENA